MSSMYYKSHYKTPLDENLIIEEVKKEGFNPLKLTDPPGQEYPSHTHKETKLLVFLEGTMNITVNGENFVCEAGDKLIIEGKAEHSARVGEKGCTFLWSEKL